MLLFMIRIIAKSMEIRPKLYKGISFNCKKKERKKKTVFAEKWYINLRVLVDWEEKLNWRVSRQVQIENYYREGHNLYTLKLLLHTAQDFIALKQIFRIECGQSQ